MQIDHKTIETKYEAIIAIENDKTISEIAKHLEIPKNTLWTWINKAEKIKECYKKSTFGSDRKRMRTAKYEDFECTKCERSYIRSIINRKTQELSRHLGYIEFKCTTGWIDGCKEHHGIIFKRVCGNRML